LFLIFFFFFWFAACKCNVAFFTILYFFFSICYLFLLHCIVIACVFFLWKKQIKILNKKKSMWLVMSAIPVYSSVPVFRRLCMAALWASRALLFNNQTLLKCSQGKKFQSPIKINESCYFSLRCMYHKCIHCSKRIQKKVQFR